MLTRSLSSVSPARPPFVPRQSPRPAGPLRTVPPACLGLTRRAAAAIYSPYLLRGMACADRIPPSRSDTTEGMIRSSAMTRR